MGTGAGQRESVTDVCRDVSQRRSLLRTWTESVTSRLRTRVTQTLNPRHWCPTITPALQSICCRDLGHPLPLMIWSTARQTVLHQPALPRLSTGLCLTSVDLPHRSVPSWSLVWRATALTLWRPLLCMGTAIKHRVPDRVKPSFVIFDIRALWRSALSVRVPGCQKLQMTA